jgi:phosphatidylserine/phosphatidylglycerophosphate/cardiolipin synthase-like enzyme
MSPPAPIGVALANSLISRLSGDYASAARLARLVALRPSSIIDERSAAIGPRARLERVAHDFVERRWLTGAGATWRAGPLDIPAGVPSFLEGAAFMQDATPDNAAAVVTMPLAPSAIAAALPMTGVSYANLVTTDDALARVADAAVESFTIMTPFLNGPGLSRALLVFNRSHARSKTLITRYSGAAARTLRAGGSAALAEASIHLLNYLIRDTDGFETFHAKVALADETLAYVGSANMTVYDRHSMELGVMMEGYPARIVASVVRAVEQIATPIVYASA